MSLLRLEWLRLARTHRWVALAAIFGALGAAGPLITKNLASIVKGAGGQSGIEVVVKHQTAVDGVSAYLGYVQQIGILVIVLVAAGALAFDARPEAAAFLRTRATTRQIILPKFLVSASAAAIAYVAGSAVAWYESAVLLGSLPVGRMLAGIGFGVIFIVFVVAVVTLAAAVFRGVVGVACSAVGFLIGLPFAATLVSKEHWVPTHLFNALGDLPRGAPFDSYIVAGAVAAVLIAVAVALAPWLSAHREI